MNSSRSEYGRNEEKYSEEKLKMSENIGEQMRGIKKNYSFQSISKKVEVI